MGGGIGAVRGHLLRDLGRGGGGGSSGGLGGFLALPAAWCAVAPAPRFRPLPVAMGVDRSFAVLSVYFLPLKADEDGHAKRVKRRAELAASWQLRHASMGPAAGSQ